MDTPVPVAVMKFPDDNEEFLVSAKYVSTCLTGNTYFTSLSTTLASLLTEIAALDVATTKAKGRAPGAASDRTAKRLKVVQRLNHIVDLVQGVAEAQANAVDAATVILSAGLKIKQVGKHAKSPLAARHGDVSGDVKLIALAVARVATYFFEYSVDQKSWEAAPPTFKSGTLLSGLKPGVVYSFRFRALTRKGMGNYADVVTLMVH